MIVRLVTMQFKKEDIDTFLKVFEKYKSKIRASEGCEELMLIQNVENPTQISTLSHWKNETYLNNYRTSEVFKEVWPQTKKLFNASPKAISYSILTIE